MKTARWLAAALVLVSLNLLMAVTAPIEAEALVGCSGIPDCSCKYDVFNNWGCHPEMDPVELVCFGSQDCL